MVLTGTNLTGATAVSFNGHAAFSYTVASATEIDAVVPGDASTGAVLVTTPLGTSSWPSFTVDAAQAPTITSFAPSTIHAGGTVTLTGSHFVGASKVQFNGVTATFTVVSDTSIQATVPAALAAGTITVTTPGGTGTSSAYIVDTSVQVQPLMNPGFEQTSPIIWQGDTGIIGNTTTSQAVPHGGSYFAYLAGYDKAATDQIYQDVFIPATALDAALSFYLKVYTSQTATTPIDTFTVSALDTSGALLPSGLLLTKSNVDVSAYKLFTVDLLPFKGQVVRLSFKGVQAGATSTSFLLDDVAVTVSVPSASDFKPIITSFTPNSGVASEQLVKINGKNLFGLTAVTIGGASASYVLTDGTYLEATVPAAASFGSAPLSITNAQGTGTSATNFSVTYGVPSLTAMNPTQGPVGTPVVLTGKYLAYPGTTLALNGTAVSGITQSVNQIAFTVPAGATTGNVVVTTPGGTATFGPFTVNTAASTLDFHIEKTQLTQSTQTLDNSVPIVAGKAGLVRVFVIANQTNTATPAVQITLSNNGAAVSGYPKTVPAPLGSVPLALNESSITSSWNLAIPATDLTTPLGSGYSVQAVVNPGGAIAEADSSNNTFTATLTGTTVPTFKTTIFPVVLSNGTGNVSEANKDAWVARLAKMYPVSSLDVQVGSPFTPSVSTLDANDTDKHWSTLLSDLALKHNTDGASDRYYFGALNVSYDSGIAGLGYVPNTSSDLFKYRTAIGWDKASGYADGGKFPEVFAHETGHNMGRQHSPCATGSNVPANPDPAYPYAGGGIGVWGYDSVLNVLHSPATDKDIMGYCTPNWVSDYVYKKILNFRGGTGGFLVVGEEDASLPKGQASPRECLLVRGIVRADGSVELLPAFRTQALPSALPATGDYTLRIVDAKGGALFTGALELVEVGCSPLAQEHHFLAALPLGTAALDATAGIEVIKEGLVKGSRRSLANPEARIVAATPEMRRVDEGHAQITWDASIHPAALVRDADTGEVIAILAGGRRAIPATGRRFDVVLSDGVTGPTHRLEAAQ